MPMMGRVGGGGGGGGGESGRGEGSCRGRGWKGGGEGGWGGGGRGGRRAHAKKVRWVQNKSPSTTVEKVVGRPKTIDANGRERGMES